MAAGPCAGSIQPRPPADHGARRAAASQGTARTPAMTFSLRRGSSRLRFRPRQLRRSTAPVTAERLVQRYRRVEPRRDDRIERGFRADQRALRVEHGGEVLRAGAPPHFGQAVRLARVVERALLGFLLLRQVLERGQRDDHGRRHARRVWAEALSSVTLALLLLGLLAADCEKDAARLVRAEVRLDLRELGRAGLRIEALHD